MKIPTSDLRCLQVVKCLGLIYSMNECVNISTTMVFCMVGAIKRFTMLMYTIVHEIRACVTVKNFIHSLMLSQRPAYRAVSRALQKAPGSPILQLKLG
jgi:hypothetical protein